MGDHQLVVVSDLDECGGGASDVPLLDRVLERLPSAQESVAAERRYDSGAHREVAGSAGA